MASLLVRTASPHATVGVVVTTLRRPAELARCLDGLRAQTRPPDEVIVVAHASDPASAALVEARRADWPALRVVSVERAGSVAALNRGLAASTREIVAFTDDDAVPSPEWAARLLDAFARDPAVAAVGGRDIVFVGDGVRGNEDQGLLSRFRERPPVGRIQWFGRQIGNHHIGAGDARHVDVLKGVNMSFRRQAVVGHGFDARLLGDGAQVHSEMSICLPLRRRGLKLLYDPAIVVHHYPAERPMGDERALQQRRQIHDFTHNEALQVLDHFGPLRQLVYGLWGVTVGTALTPGLVNLARLVVTGAPQPLTAFVAAQSGRLDAWRTHATPRPRPG